MRRQGVAYLTAYLFDEVQKGLPVSLNDAKARNRERFCMELVKGKLKGIVREWRTNREAVVFAHIVDEDIVVCKFHIQNVERDLNPLRAYIV